MHLSLESQWEHEILYTTVTSGNGGFMTNNLFSWGSVKHVVCAYTNTALQVVKCNEPNVQLVMWSLAQMYTDLILSKIDPNHNPMHKSVMIINQSIGGNRTSISLALSYQGATPLIFIEITY